jgi:TolA-binding protein
MQGELPAVPVSVGLAEAESLLQELEGQQGTLAPDAQNVEDTPSWAMPEGAAALEGGESDETVYNRARTAGRRRGRRQKSFGGKLVRIAVWLIVLGAVAAGGVYTYNFYGEFTATEQETYNQAARLRERGEFIEASKAFANFAAEHPNSPRTPEAEFAAANSLWMVPDSPDGAAEQSYQQAIALFGAFIQNNPGHKKVARAEILTGILYAKLGQHEQAVRTLYDPDRRLLDQVGYLNALRTMARSYAELGEVESTHAAFLRAASLSENPTPDRDFLELAAIYQGWADRAETEDLRHSYQEAAIRQWNRALQVPGLVKARIDSIEAHRDALLYTMKGEAASSALTDSQ